MHSIQRILITAALVANSLGALEAQPIFPQPPSPRPALLTAEAPPGPQGLAEHAELMRDGLAPMDPVVAASLPRYLSSNSSQFLDWLADDSMLIATRCGETQQIERLRAPLGMREQLSFAPSGVIAAAARPDSSDAVVYLAAHAGGGTQLFLNELGAHSLRALTDGSYVDQMPTWAPDGRRVAFLSNRRGADDDVYVLDPRAPDAPPQALTARELGRWRIYGWSSDAHHLLLGREAALDGPRAPASSEAQIYLADADSGALVATPLWASAASFASDGSGLLLVTHQLRGNRSEYLHLVYVDPSAGRWRELSTPVNQDVERFAASPDGRFLAYTLEDRGVNRLRLIDQQLQLDVLVSVLPEGIISGLKFDASGQHLALTFESTRSAPDVYVLQTSTRALTRWTQSAPGPLDTQSFIQPQWLQFPTWDRPDGQARELSVLAYDPAASSLGGGAPRPVVIWLCSGAGSQCRPRYAPFVQYLAQQLGFVVLAPNVRGSSGLGASLQAAGEGSLREDAVRDVGSLLAWIGLQPGLDRSRVALLGEGFGSYLALASLTQYGDRLLGAVAAFPPPLAELNNVVAIRRPVLLVQGLENPSVPAYEAAQLREGLRAQGVAVQYLAASDEGADFKRQSARDAYQIAAANFLAQLLR